MKTKQKTIRLPNAVDEALGGMARARKMEPADLMADILSEFALKEGDLGKEEKQQVRAETKLKKRVRELAQEICAESFEPHVTLRVFQQIQRDSELCALYEEAIGTDGKTKGNHTKARINRALGSIIKVAVGGRARTEEGHRVSIQVEDEFIFNYTLLNLASVN